MKILFFIAQNDFHDEEYFIPRNIFLKEGFEVFTVSTRKELAVGSYGGEVEVDFSLEEVRINQYNAVVFIGGKGALKDLDNEEVYKIIREISPSVVLAAICIAPLILLNAGVLENKKATVWSSSLNRLPIKMMKEKRVLYIEENVVCDGNIITANGPEAAENFATKIIENLTKNRI
jgi:protease I